MSFSVSVGDIMLLSSFAWKIGRAFTSGRSGAPAEFTEVKNELESLASAIACLCECLEADDSVLSRADDTTKQSLEKILDSCRVTLENLESLVKQYQEVIKPDESHSSVQRRWTASFLRNYKKMWWTSEGGNIQDLRNMLHMHSQSITITMQALQSKSLTRLERTVEPMAKQVEGIHDTVVGSINAKIAEMHALMMSMNSPISSPWLAPKRQNTLPDDFEMLDGSKGTSAAPVASSRSPPLEPRSFENSSGISGISGPAPDQRRSTSPPTARPVHADHKPTAEGDRMSLDARGLPNVPITEPDFLSVPSVPVMNPQIRAEPHSVQSMLYASDDLNTKESNATNVGKTSNSYTDTLGVVKPDAAEKSHVTKKRADAVRPQNLQSSLDSTHFTSATGQSMSPSPPDIAYGVPKKPEGETFASIIPRSSSITNVQYINSVETTPDLSESGFSAWASPVLSQRNFARSRETAQELYPVQPPPDRSPRFAVQRRSDTSSALSDTRWGSISTDMSAGSAMALDTPPTAFSPQRPASSTIGPYSPIQLPPPALSTEERNGSVQPILLPPPRYSTFPVDEDIGQAPIGQHLAHSLPPPQVPFPVPTTPQPQPIQRSHTAHAQQDAYHDLDDPSREVRKKCTPEEYEAFKSTIFRDAMVLCEIHVKKVEYTQVAEEGSEDPTRLEEACQACTISVVTKMYKVSQDKTRFITSIWALSTDRTVRLQHKLGDETEIIPYTIWGNTEKVVVRVPTELRYHALSPKDRPLETASTAWVNYVFANSQDATEFQNALMGKRLLHTFKTRRTLRLHDSLVSSAFSYQEQLCGLENLRLWSDYDSGYQVTESMLRPGFLPPSMNPALGQGMTAGDVMPESDDSVLAMIQYSASFKPGYLAFRLRGPYTTVKVEDGGDRWVKVRGIEVSLAAEGTDLRALRQRSSTNVEHHDTERRWSNGSAKKERIITGCKIEFERIEDKVLFLDLYRVQRKPGRGKVIGA